MGSTTSDLVRVWVDPTPMGRLTGWVVRCDGCPARIFLPNRTKALAEGVATNHSKEVHQGRGVVAVKKTLR